MAKGVSKEINEFRTVYKVPKGSRRFQNDLRRSKRDRRS